MSNGEPVLVDKSNPAKPQALAGAALAEAAEQLGGRFTGWVTDVVKSGVLSCSGASCLTAPARHSELLALTERDCWQKPNCREHGKSAYEGSCH
jgi:hypothetical protein